MAPKKRGVDKHELARQAKRRRALRSIAREQHKLDLKRRAIEAIFNDENEPPVMQRPLPRFKQAEVDEFFREYASDGFVKRMDRLWSREHRGSTPPREADSPYIRALLGTFEQGFPMDPDGVYARLLVEVGQRDPWETEDVTDSP